jgi:hypothetical protein
LAADNSQTSAGQSRINFTASPSRMHSRSARRMETHRRLNQSRDDLCAGALHKSD